MNEVDEILDYDDNVDFSFTEDPQVDNSNLMEGDGLFDLDAEMSFTTNTEEKSSTERKDKEDSELTDNQLSENLKLDNNSQQKDQEELKFGEIGDFDMGDPDFLNDYGEVNTDDVPIEDDEFWKELGLDPPTEVVEEGNEKSIEKSGTSDNFDIDNTNISKSTPKENTPKRSTSQSDAIKANSTKLDKSKRTSPEKEDGEIINTSTSTDNNRQGQQQSQKQKLPQSQQQAQAQRQAQTQRTQVQRQQQQNNHHQQQTLQNYRGRGGRRNNDWRQVNNNGSFLNSGFRSGFGPGLEGMPGMPMGQMPLNNPPMMPNLNIPPGMIGPNIHVNPNFARLRPHALPFGNPMSQYPMGSGGPPMNMMPYQGQMDMHPYHSSMSPMGSGRGNNGSYAGRGGSPGFNHNTVSPRRPTSQQNSNQTQRPIQSSPKRKVPNDGFDQKEPDNKKVSVINGKKSPVPDAKSIPASQKNIEKSKAVSSPATKSFSSPPAAKVSNSKQGTSTTNSNKTVSTATKNKVAPVSSNTSTAKQAPKPAQKSGPKNTVRNAPSKASTASSPHADASISKPNIKTGDVSTSKSTAKTGGASSSVGNKLTIGNVDERVTKRDIQELANNVPGGFSSITFDRSAQTAEVAFKTSEGAKMFRRMYNRSVLGGSNIVINFS